MTSEWFSKEEESHLVSLKKSIGTLNDRCEFLSRSMPIDGSSQELLNNQPTSKKKRSHKKRRHHRKSHSKGRILDTSDINNQSVNGIKNALNGSARLSLFFFSLIIFDSLQEIELS